MAVKAVSVTMTVDASASASALSAPIVERHRPISILVWADQSAAGSFFRVFLTKQSTPNPEPQPGDPPVFDLRVDRLFGTNVFFTPLAMTTIVDPPVQVNLFFNNAATAAANVIATYVYETV
ncbi:MAG: hypothetical protein QXG57_06200 [Thermofilaceae archaeon]